MARDVFRIDLSWQTLWRFLGFCAVIAFIFFARRVIGILFVSVVVSLGLDPFVSFLEGKKINRLLGTLIVFFLLFLLISLGVYFMIPVFTIEASGFLKHLHDITYSIFGVGLPENLVEALTFSRDKVFEFLSNADISVAQTVTNLLTAGISVFATILITFYLSIEKDGTERLLKVVLPDAYERSVLKIFQHFKVKIRRWFAAQLGLSLIVGIVVAVGLSILGVRYSLVLGILAAIFELVPVIGPIFVGALAFLVAIPDSFLLGVYTIIFFFIVQQLENHVLIPAIIGRTMKVHPVVVLLSLLAGGEIAGLLGVILAVPVAVIAQEIFNHLSELKDRRSYLV